MRSKPIRFLVALTSLVQKRSWGPFTEAYEATKFDHAFSVSWSQAGEDLSLMPILGNISNGRYLDVGAHHPSRFSVTRHLFQSGWSGVNVDANIDLINAFRVQRPLDTSINYCVGTESTYVITIFTETAISTVNSEWESRFKSEKNEVAEKRTVQGITLKAIIEKYFPEGTLDFLNVDIEGADLDALKSAQFQDLHFNLWPKWILIEANSPLENALHTPSLEFLLEFDYQVYLVLPYAVLLKKPFARN